MAEPLIDLKDTPENETRLFDEGIQRDYPTHLTVFLYLAMSVGAMSKVLISWGGNQFKGTVFYLINLSYLIPALGFGFLLGLFFQQYPQILDELVTDEYSHDILSKYTTVELIQPDKLLQIFLPILVFECAFAGDTGIFKKKLKAIGLLSIGDLGATITAVAMYTWYVKKDEEKVLADGGVILFLCFIFGAMVSATDLTEVTYALKRSGNQQILGGVSQSSDMLNKAISVTVFRIVYQIYELQLGGTEDKDNAIIELVLLKTLLSPVLGWAFGYVCNVLLNLVYSEPLMQVSLIYSFLYISFFTSNAVGASGTFCVAFFGLELDHTIIFPMASDLIKRISKMLVFIANCILFALCGLFLIRKLDILTVEDIKFISIIYGIMLGARMALLILLWPFLWWMIGFKLKHLIAFTWGGLRSSISLLMAFYFYYEQSFLVRKYRANFDDLVNDGRADRDLQEHWFYGDELRLWVEKFTLYVCCLVIISAAVNNTFLKILMRLTGLECITRAQHNTMKNAMHVVRTEVAKIIANLKESFLYADAKWKVVEQGVRIEYPYRDFEKAKEDPQPPKKKKSEATIASKASKKAEKKEKKTQKKNQKKNQVAPEVSTGIFNRSKSTNGDEEYEETRVRLLKAVKLSYERQQRSGMLTVPEFRVLTNLCDDSVNKVGHTYTVQAILKYMHSRGWLPKMLVRMENVIYGKEGGLVPPRRKWRRFFYNMVVNKSFDYTMQFIIFLNTIPIALEFALQDSWNNYDTWELSLRIVNYAFIAAYIFEFLFKYLGLGFKQYIKQKWNQFDFSILIFSIIEVITDVVVLTLDLKSEQQDGEDAPVLDFNMVTTIIRVLRTTRLLRLSKSFFPKYRMYILRKIDDSITFGFNIGKGFLVAEEILSKLLHSLYVREDVLQRLIRNSEKNRIEATYELRELQNRYPMVCMRVRTRMAIRQVLLGVGEHCDKQLLDGNISNQESVLVHLDLKKALKREVYFPRVLPSRPYSAIVQQIPWLRGDRRAQSFFYKRSEFRYFDINDMVLLDQDDPHGIWIILKGQVKIKGMSDGHVGFLPHFPDQSGGTSILDARTIGLVSNHTWSTQERCGYPHYLSIGSAIGEWKFLTKSMESPMVTCQTALETMYISRAIMKEGFERFPYIERRLWQNVGARIVLPLYTKYPPFIGKQTRVIMHHLMKGVVVELSCDRLEYEFENPCEEVIILHGSVCGHKGTTLSRRKIHTRIHTKVFTLKNKEDSAVLFCVPKRKL